MTGTNLFAHVKHMMWTTVPSFVLATVLFAVIGFAYSADSMDDSQIQMICGTLQRNFHITPWILIAPVSIIVMMILKVPAIPGMVFGTAVGVVFAFLQGNDVGTVISQLVYGFEIASGNDMVDQLLNRGGMQNMMYTISLVICGTCLWRRGEEHRLSGHPRRGDSGQMQNQRRHHDCQHHYLHRDELHGRGPVHVHRDTWADV